MSETHNISGPSAMTGQQTIYGATIPPEGPKAVGFMLDFVDFTTNVIDFTYAYEQRQMTVVQSIYVDNSQNPDPLTITAQNAPFQSLTIPANTQGTYPLISAIRPRFNLTTNGSCVVGAIFCNIPLPSSNWSAVTPASVAPGAGAATAVTTGGTAVAVFADAGDGLLINGGRVVNPFNASESLFLDYINAAATTAPGTYGTTFELVPGQTENVPAGFDGTLTANAVTNGHTFTAFGLGGLT